MELQDLTLEQLTEARPDLVKSVEARIAESADAKGKDEQIATLKEQVDKLETEKRAAEASAEIGQLLGEAKLPEWAVSDLLTEQLRDAENSDARKAIIEDRRQMVQQSKTGKPISKPAGGVPASFDNKSFRQSLQIAG